MCGTWRGRGLTTKTPRPPRETALLVALVSWWSKSLPAPRCGSIVAVRALRQRGDDAAAARLGRNQQLLAGLEAVAGAQVVRLEHRLGGDAVPTGDALEGVALAHGMHAGRARPRRRGRLMIRGQGDLELFA